MTLHTSDRVFGSFPYEGELAYQNATSGASGTVVYRNMTSGMIRIRHSIGAFDTIGKLSFSRTQSTSNAPVSAMRLGYVKLRVGRVRGNVLFTTTSPLFLSSSGDIGAPTIVEPRFPASSVVSPAIQHQHRQGGRGRIRYTSVESTKVLTSMGLTRMMLQG